MKVAKFAGLQALSGDRRSCGSAFFLGVHGANGYVCSNAHVWGTAIGSQCYVRGVADDGRVIEFGGRLKYAAMIQGRAVDWAICELPLNSYLELPGATESHRLVDLVETLPIGYVGGPRCELPSFRRVRFARISGAIAYGTPAAIGGMSGGAWQHDGAPCAITTWTDGTHNMAQPAQALRATMRPEFFGALNEEPTPEPECPCEREKAFAVFGGFSPSDFALPAGAVVACEHPQVCVDGYHAEVGDMSALDLVDACSHPREFGLADEPSSNAELWLELIRLILPLILEILRKR